MAYHSPMEGCPDKYTKWKCSKWRHNFGFPAEEHFYNYWYAKEHIRRDGVAIIVESPGNVWRIEEAGIPYSIGSFGAHITPGQRGILDNSGALALIVLTDPDQAGILAREAIEKECGKSYSTYYPKLNNIDIGETDAAEVKEKLDPVIEMVKRDLGI